MADSAAGSVSTDDDRAALLLPLSGQGRDDLARAEEGGAWLGPLGAIAGAIAGGYFGADAGDYLGRKFGPYLLRRDPLILDLDGGGAHLTALRAPAVYFDLDSDGFREQTGWVRAGEALLARDLNGNGLIDNGGELFGTATRDGFSILRDYDANADGVINAADAVWSTLLLWRDLDQDGLTDAGELSTLASRGVVSISLAETASNEVRDGNSILFTGGFTRTDGSTSEVIAVAFATDQINTHYDLPEGFGVRVDLAPSCQACMNTTYATNDNEASCRAA